MAATAPGDSSAQREAEAVILSSLSTKLGIDLGKRKFEVEGGWLEIDGVGGAPPTILVEVWAHLGKPKSAQKSKVMKDAFKLLYASSLLTRQGFPKPRLMLAFADEDAASHFRGDSWMAHALDAQGIECVVSALPSDVRASVLHAQKRQYR